VSQIIRRLLSLLFHLKIYNKHYKIVWTGEVISANKFYQSRHWSIRAGYKTKLSEAFTILLLEAKVKAMSEISLIVFSNHRVDIDNHGIQNKILIDTMKDKYITDDTKKYYVSTHTIYDASLPKNTTEYHIIGR
jgi:hypothetical protein